MALKHNNNTHKDNAEPDAEYFNVKPVFILESDIFGSSKPDKNNYLTHTELFKCIDLTIPANHLNGLQRVIGGVWRIYPDSEEDRETLVVSSITVRKKRIEVYPRNPKYVEKESPTTVRIRIKNIPLSADDGQLIRYLQNWHLEVLNYQRERLRIDGFVTNCQTGDRIFYVEPFDITIPRNVKIGKYRGLIFYKGQTNQNAEIECTKCLQKGHKKSECTNDWKCKTCGTNGHISKDCTAEFDKNSQADSDVSSEESDEASESESEKGEEIVLSQSTENLLDITHTEEISKNAELPTDTNNTNVPDQNPSELKSDETDQQHPEQCMKKKKKKKKTSKSPATTYGPLDKYLGTTMTTPQQKSSKRSATTPTDKLHDREIGSSKPRTSDHNT
ncbi:CNBP [Mytilus edulis]|uniref:CNBP n=1 Tax=Mytilus edulis TaxID=6550 RepID=A0A8S3PQG9_MYTED|nr:CNBP [Mytilus edulis]